MHVCSERRAALPAFFSIRLAMAKRRVVLTGATGYVAQRMWKELNERWDVVGIDVRETTRDGVEVPGVIVSDLTLRNYERTLLFWRPDSIDAATNGIVNSFVLALAGASIAMVLALVVSYMIHRTRGFGARMLDFLCVIPIGFPGIVLAMGVLVTYIKTPIYATLWILLLGYITRFFPYGQRNVSSVMLAISEELDQSSRMSGASWLTTLRRVTIPLLKPGIFAGWVLLFIIFLRELSISIILYTAGTETLSVGVYYLANFENEPLTSALSIAQTVVLLLCVVVFRRIAGREALTA